MHPLFTRPLDLRVRGERRAASLTALWALPVAGIVGGLLNEHIGLSQVALFAAGAIVYLTLARGRLLGAAIRVHETQHPRLFAVVRRCAEMLGLPVPPIFIREAQPVPIVMLGIGPPYALVVSAERLEDYTDDELAFEVGRALGHTAAGHTRFLSMLSVAGNENAIVAFIFGAWLRRCELTCDRIGLLCCGSLDDALRAIVVGTFRRFGRTVDLDAFARQAEEIAGDPLLRWGESLGGDPYVTRRMQELRNFAASPLYERARAWIAAEEKGRIGSASSHRDGITWGRRFAAYAIDWVVVLALAGTINAFLGPSQSGPEPPQPHTISVERGADERAELMPGVTYVPHAVGALRTSADEHAKRHARAQPHAHASRAPAISIPLNVDVDRNGIRTVGVLVLDPAEIPWRRFALVVTAIVVGPWLRFALYLAVLVALTTQSVGLLVMDLRILDGRLRRAPLWRIVVRYLSVALLWWLILPLSFFTASCMLHDRLSGTRVVPGERLLAREG